MLYAAIRRDVRDGLSIRAVMCKHGVAHPTVRQALDSAWPKPRKKTEPRASLLDPFKPVIDAMLRTDLDAPRKQRHTVKRILDRLVDEHDARVSYGIVRRYVAERRPQIRMEAGRGPVEAFISQTHRPGPARPGAEAEVDFGDVTVRIGGQQVTCYLFSLRLSYSGKALHRVFTSGGQEAFFEGHVHAFEVLGVPFGKIRYDNLKAAVAQITGFTRQRVETERWTAFRSHYGIESFYCRPGVEGAHEKGGVEGQIGWFRRNHFVSVAEVDSLAGLNQMIDRWDEQDEARRIRARPRTIAELFAVERPLLRSLPVEAFETGRHFSLRVDRRSRISVRTNRYSVPVRLIGRMVQVVLHASELVVYDGREEVVRHERIRAKGGRHLGLDHYLEALVRKPGALPGATALEQARAAGKFTPLHDAWWAAASKAHGDREGTRALIDVLLLNRQMNHEHVVAGIAAALRAGALTADAVALEARKAAAVTSLTERRLAQLPPDRRPLPSVSHYDQLLRRRPPGRQGPASQEEAR